MPRRVAGIVFFALLAIAAVGPIRSYDAFWHLATGRWIVEHHALPLTDPFAVASDRSEWIDGEWLYQIALYAVHSIGGLGAISIAHALLAAAIFTAALLFASRSCDASLALLAASIAFLGAADRLGVRPAAMAALFVVIGIELLDRDLTLAYVALTILWINVHPSALLAPVLAATTIVRDRRRIGVTLASAMALLVNPYGYQAILAPFRLSAFASSGAFINTEWLPSPPLLFPLLFLTIVAGSALFVWRRVELWRFTAFALLALLAVRYVRNQPLFFAAAPLLLAPLLPKRAPRAVALLAIVPIGLAFVRTDHTPGIDAHRFPVRSAARLKASGLQGNVYDADQFGGYLIWTFYPQRRVLTDGRNELFHVYIDEDRAAHYDSRAWNALLRKYRVDLAVDETGGPPIVVIDAVTHAQRTMPAWQARYPARSWAVIGRDDVSMVFARRAAFPPQTLASWEVPP